MTNRTKMLYMNPNRIEYRFRDRRGREHYDNGRYAPMRNNYEREGDYRERRYRDEREEYPRPNHRDMMLPIGFTYDDERYYDRYNSTDNMRGEMTGGHADGYDMMELTQRDITEWLDGMENEDGTHGAHWNMEKSEQIRKQRNIECDPVDFNIAMNIMYSDYCKVAQKMSVNNVDFYAHMAKAFLDDKDSRAEDKLAAYYYAIVR